MYLRNRRAHPRVLLNADGWYASLSGDTWQSIKALDISKGGFAFVTQEKIDMGSTRQFRLQMPGGSRLMNFDGRITHCIELLDIKAYRVGVQFNKMDVADLATIEWYVDHKDSVQT